MRTFLVALILLFAAPAAAGNWADCEALTTSKRTVGTYESICFVPVAGDLDSIVLAGNQCDNFDLKYFCSSCVTTCQVLECSDSACTKTFPVRNMTLTGSSGSRRMDGIGLPWFKVDCTGNPSPAGSSLFLAHCNP